MIPRAFHISATLLLSSLACSAAYAAPIDPGMADRVARLDRDVVRANSVRQVKRVQHAYAHFAEFGLWDQMADLFADRGVLQIGKEKVRGRKAILTYMIRYFGRGKLGLAPGDVTTRLQMTPVINLSVDGRTAKGRWHELAMLGQLGGEARWAGGISENDYVLEEGRWKIARLHLTPMYAGSYEDGWKALEPDIPVVPVHFTPDSAGIPVPATTAKLPAVARPGDAESAAMRRVCASRRSMSR